MRKGTASRTADIATAYRAVEAMRPESERVCYDPYAKEFLSGIYRIGLKSRLLTKLLLLYSKKVGPGTRGWTIGRHRYIDEYLKTCVEDGIRQLVILGAGLDTRAYRCSELKGKVKVFEVDHPDTQKLKVEKIKKLFGSLSSDVTYVPINFNKERLDNRLFESGYEATLKTLFIWEAVTMYLTPQAVDNTLSFVAEKSGKGSSIIFDYILKSVVDGTCDLDEAKKIQKAVERRGDPFTFGLDEASVENFLYQRGYCQITNVNWEFLKDAYFGGANKSIQVSPLFGYVCATINKKE